MRALQFTAYGGPEVLVWADAPTPHAGPRQIRIAVRAASVNPIDWKMFTGVLSGGKRMVGTGYLGYDAAGVVDEIGEGVTDISVGDEVLGRGQHTQAEYAVLDSWAAKPGRVGAARCCGGHCHAARRTRLPPMMVPYRLNRAVAQVAGTLSRLVKPDPLNGDCGGR